jgi:putative multiple sugar transport system substrate-binding protein
MSPEAAAQLAHTQLVGISLPSSTGPHDRADGEDLTHRLTSAGFGVRTDYAGDDPGTQVAQVRAMLDDGADALVVGAVDGAVLAEVLAMAELADVPVVEHDVDGRSQQTVASVRTLLGAQTGARA